MLAWLEDQLMQWAACDLRIRAQNPSGPGLNACKQKAVHPHGLIGTLQKRGLDSLSRLPQDVPLPIATVGYDADVAPC